MVTWPEVRQVMEFAISLQPTASALNQWGREHKSLFDRLKAKDPEGYPGLVAYAQAHRAMLMEGV